MSITTWNEVFSETFLFSFCSFWKLSKQTSKKNSFHLWIRYHTADEHIHINLQRWMHYVLETNTVKLVLETNAFHAGDEHQIIISAVKKPIESAHWKFSLTHTHTHKHMQLATSYLQTEFMLRRLLDKDIHIHKWVLWHCKDQMENIVVHLDTCTTAFSVATNWSSRLSQWKKL